MENDDESWAKVARSLETPSVADDSRFATAEGRAEHAEDLVALLDGVLQKKGADYWLERWKKEGIVAASIGTLADLAADDQAWANDYLLKTHCDEVNREVTVRGLPVGFSKTPGKVESLGPQLGQDTEIILFETLGYTWDDIGELKAKGAIL
jgi:crotonobetainyl-CoA:carnitine CoA-transferase CaiB-like acyl-CoA transferase